MARRHQLKTLSELLFPLSPKLAIRFADARGRKLSMRAMHRETKYIPTSAELEELLGPGAGEAYEEFARKCGRSGARTRLVKSLAAGKGPELILPIMAVDGEEHLRELKEEGKGALIATWHSGPTPAVWASLIPHDIPLMKLQHTEWLSPPANWEILDVPNNSFDSIRLLRRAQKHLRQGGWMGAAVDVGPRFGPGCTVRCFGRRMEFEIGLAALAVKHSRPIVPISASWDGQRPRILVRVHAPLHPGSGGNEESAVATQRRERELSERIIRVMERDCLDHPWEWTAPRVRRFLAFPRVTQEEGG